MARSRLPIDMISLRRVLTSESLFEANLIDGFVDPPHGGQTGGEI
jgi:hypothetical protein